MRVDIVTDDDDQRIDTILDVENQRQNLKELAEKFENECQSKIGLNL